MRALQAELSDRVYVHGDAPDFVWFRVRDPDGYVYVHGDAPDFVWFRVRDPDGYPIEVYWEDSA